MHALDRLPELHLVAEQHEVARRCSHRDQVGERDLARLVDEQVVDGWLRTAGSANSHAVPAISWRFRAMTICVRRTRFDEPPSVHRLGILRTGFLDAGEREALLVRALLDRVAAGCG